MLQGSRCAVPARPCRSPCSRAAFPRKRAHSATPPASHAALQRSSTGPAAALSVGKGGVQGCAGTRRVLGGTGTRPPYLPCCTPVLLPACAACKAGRQAGGCRQHAHPGCASRPRKAPHPPRPRPPAGHAGSRAGSQGAHVVSSSGRTNRQAEATRGPQKQARLAARRAAAPAGQARQARRAPCWPPGWVGPAAPHPSDAGRTGGPLGRRPRSHPLQGHEEASA